MKPSMVLLFTYQPTPTFGSSLPSVHVVLLSSLWSFSLDTSGSELLVVFEFSGPSQRAFGDAMRQTFPEIQ
jgi:hypothetical protein